MFKGREATSDQMAAAAQQRLEFLREQLLIFLRQKREAAVRKMTQAGAGGKSTDEDLSWLESTE